MKEFQEWWISTFLAEIPVEEVSKVRKHIFYFIIAMDFLRMKRKKYWNMQIKME